MNDHLNFVKLDPDGIPSKLKELFPLEMPQSKRCFAVLDGIEREGKVLTDDPDDPTWAVVQERYENTVFFGGEFNQTIAAQIITELRKVGEVIVGLWHQDPTLALLPPDNYYDGAALEFYDRPIGEGLEKYFENVPASHELRMFDRELVMKTEWGAGDVELAGSLENWEQDFIGCGLIRNGEVIAEASAGPPCRGIYEPGVFTREAHRGNGYGILVSARLI